MFGDAVPWAVLGNMFLVSRFATLKKLHDYDGFGYNVVGYNGSCVTIQKIGRSTDLACFIVDKKDNKRHLTLLEMREGQTPKETEIAQRFGLRGFRKVSRV